jgi:cytochrome c peroxidase
MTLKGKSLIAAAAAVTVSVGAWLAHSHLSKPRPTPLEGFSAPFVFGRFSLPEANPLTRESVELGRRLFYDTRLSGNNQVSCATCHVQDLAFTDGRRTAIGVSGKPLALNSMSLANLMWGPRHFFWNGRSASLEEQALVPIQHQDEMDQDLEDLLGELASDPEYVRQFAAAYGDISAESLASALAAFERTQISSNSRYDQFLRGERQLSDLEEHGRKLFMAHPDVKVSLRGGNCIDCHSQFLTSGFNTSFDGFTNNGLDSEADLAPGLSEVTGKQEHRGLFKTPTLRNIALTAPYMHDGRFSSLEEVLDHYNEGIKGSSTLSPLMREAGNEERNPADRISLNLTEDEQTAIIAFLHTLTDEQFVTDSQFSDPFLEP